MAVTRSVFGATIRPVRDCKQIREDLSDAIDGELPWSRRVALKLHLLVCPGCRREREELARTVGLLKKCKKRGRCDE